MKKLFVRLAAKELLVTKGHFDAVNKLNPFMKSNMFVIGYEDKDGNKCDEFGNLLDEDGNLLDNDKNK